MTSNTTPSGIASANINNSTAFNAFNSTGWDASNSGGAYFINYQFPLPKIISGFTVTITSSSNVAWGNLQASKDGVNWIVIPSSNPFLVGPVILSNNTTPYKYYRLNLNGVGSSSLSGIIWQLSGY